MEGREEEEREGGREEEEEWAEWRGGNSRVE